MWVRSGSYSNGRESRFNGTWNGGMVERAVNDPVPSYKSGPIGHAH